RSQSRPMATPRRKFLKTTAAGIGTLAFGALGVAQVAPKSAARRPVDGVGLPPNWRAMRKLDAHNHVFSLVHRQGVDWGEVERLVEAAELLGIERLFCSRPVVAGVLADIGTVRDSNDAVLAAMKRYPERIAGYCFVQPGNGADALEEIERCLDAG